MTYLRDYLQRRRYRREIRSALRQQGLDLVARSMWRLNRHAYRDWLNKDQIYSYKNLLIKRFHQLQPHPAGMQVQTMPCWECDGSGVCENETTPITCWKCDGTGIWRRHRLYVFRFDVGCRRYIWHMPERLVDWPVELVVEHEPAEFTPHDLPDGDVWLSEEDLDRCLAVVYEWLRSQGEQIDPPSFRYDMTPGWALSCQIESAFPSLEKLRRSVRAALAAWTGQRDDDQIPF